MKLLVMFSVYLLAITIGNTINNLKIHMSLKLLLAVWYIILTGVIVYGYSKVDHDYQILKVKYSIQTNQIDKEK